MRKLAHWLRILRMMPVERHPQRESTQTRSTLLALALLYLRLGMTAFGGPAVHISMMEEEVVTRRGWLTRADFLDFLGGANLIPGPNSTEMAIHVGRVRAGWAGLLVAGVSFILPAALMVGCLAWAYLRYGTLPQIGAVLYGVKPVVIVVIAQGAFRLAKSAVKSTWLGVLGLAAVLAAALGIDPSSDNGRRRSIGRDGARGNCSPENLLRRIPGGNRRPHRGQPCSRRSRGCCFW